MPEMACARSCSCGAHCASSHRSRKTLSSCSKIFSTTPLIAILLLWGGLSADASRQLGQARQPKKPPNSTISGGGSKKSDSKVLTTLKTSLLGLAAAEAIGRYDFETGKTGAAAAAPPAGASQPQSSTRSLKQIPAFDPYGIGYYDPYVAGVTPGFINLDLNRETGLHLGVGDAVVDVSADKNYVGVGVGQGFGFGKARDRGWNLQLGGGNVLDVSVTRDAGLGLWVLDGLVNVNIGPDGRDTSRSNFAAQGVSAAAPAPEVTSVVVDDSTTASSAGATQIVVDDMTASYPTYTTGAFDPNVEQNPPFPVYTTGGPEAVNPATTDFTTATATEQTSQGYPTYTTGSESSSVEVEQIPTYTTGQSVNPTLGLENTLPSYDFLENLDYEATPAPAFSTQAVAPGATPNSYMVPRPAAEDNAVWSTASQYSDTARMGAARLSGLTFSGPSAAGAVPTAVQSAATVPPVANTAAPRRACEGGEMVWASGNKFKCRYKRASAVQVAPGQNTYPNGVAVR